MNFYQIDTQIQLGVTFYNVAANVPEDPTAISLFVEDPSGNVTEIPSANIQRTSVGVYFSLFLPPSPGLWKYKWQGSGATVIATSPDTPFFVRASSLIED